MDIGDDLRLRQHQKVIVTLQIAAMGAEALTAEGILIQPVLLNHGAHGAIEHDDSLFQQTFQALDTLATLGLIRGRDPKRNRSGSRHGSIFQRNGTRCVRMIAALMPASAHATARCLLAGRTPSAWQIAYVSSARFKV